MIGDESVNSVFTWRELSSTHSRDAVKRRVDTKRVARLKTRCPQVDSEDLVVDDGRRNSLIPQLYSDDTFGLPFGARLVSIACHVAESFDFLNRTAWPQFSNALIGEMSRRRYPTRCGLDRAAISLSHSAFRHGCANRRSDSRVASPVF